ncbi:hypothetical protein E2F43_02150 [Seongchinamella unica]|uniref:Tetratricopeptide repeat protein n=1 Tax=Seongchinamella unica TaxID=2547392 RepID=A0A4R5LUI5_9GAMM|nr:hypothetical protein [Seongchinamella unica]TDG15064.1 hypothetical protein E2F43_02150 [Seongchinamella unica]
MFVMQTKRVASIKAYLFLSALVAYVAWLYAPGVNGPYLLDDFSSLGHLPNLGERPEWSFDYAFGDQSGLLGRFVSMSTFVLEAAISDDIVASGKQSNIFLHVLTGVLLAWFLELLLSFTSVRNAGLIAVPFAAIWLVAPLHVSTVLYVVQRMAILATMFSIASLICYLLWRKSQVSGHGHSLYMFACLFFGALAVLSKENGILFIPLILLLELLYLQFEGVGGDIDARIKRIVVFLLVFGIAVMVLVAVIKWDWIQSGYSIREFTLQQRVLTQARALWDYVGQFYHPDMSRLGLFHDDYEVSSSVLQPLSTLTSLLGLAVVLGIFLFSISFKRCRRLVFGPVFFIVAHSLESSILPLELYFEHRNYLPSIGLVILPLVVFVALLRKWPEVGSPLLVWVWIYVLWLSLQASSQVQIWSSSPLLAMQHVNGHPESARANKEYAFQLASAGAGDGALKYSQLAFGVSLKHTAAADESHGDYVLRNIALSCVAGKPLFQAEYEKLGAVEPSRPLGDVNTMSTVVKLRQGDVCPDFDWEGFLDHLAGLYLQTFDTTLASAQMFSALAMLANAQQRWEDAYQYTERFLALSPDSVRGMLMQLHFSTALNRREQADKFIARLQKLQDAGKLNRGEQDTLALYLEN